MICTRQYIQTLTRVSIGTNPLRSADPFYLNFITHPPLLPPLLPRGPFFPNPEENRVTIQRFRQLKMP